MILIEKLLLMCPSDGVSNYNVNLGLLLQFHYVGLDLVDSSFEDENIVSSSLCTNTVIDNPNSSTSNAHNTDEFSDNIIAIGDQHDMSINGGPQVCSMLSIENPETENYIFSCTCQRSETSFNDKCLTQTNIPSVLVDSILKGLSR